MRSFLVQQRFFCYATPVQDRGLHLIIVVHKSQGVFII